MRVGYYPVIRKELERIKDNCKFPDAEDCSECDCRNNPEEECRYNGANALVEEVLTRPDPLEILEAWRTEYIKHVKLSYIELWELENQIINLLRENPSAVEQQGRDEGWWPE